MTAQQRIDFEAQGYLTWQLKADDLAQLSTAFERSGEGLNDLPNRDDAFIHLAEHPDIFPVVHAILSDEVQLRHLNGFVCLPHSAGRGWHKEVAGLLGVDHALSTLCVQVFICLDDTPSDGACFMVVPGSHRFKSDVPFPKITYIKEMPHAVTLPVGAGTVVVLHGNIWQARTRNESNDAQRFINVTYAHCWMRHALPELSTHALEVIDTSTNLQQLFAVRDVTQAGGYWAGQLEGYADEVGLPKRRFSPLKVVGRETVPNE